MSTGWFFLLTVTLLVCWQCLAQQVASSCNLEHPQQKFCDADYVFRFRAMTRPQREFLGINGRGGRHKRLVSGGPMRQMAKVERFYKGKEMAMPMIIMTHENDTFTNDDEMEASLRLGDTTSMKMNEVYIYFGKLIRDGSTILPITRQVMMTGCGKTMAKTELTKVIKRGLRKRYKAGSVSGCKVMTVFYKMPKSKTHCYWNPNYYYKKVDCCKTTQFCHMGKFGFCEWKKTKAFKKCKSQNKSRSKDHRKWP